MLNTITKQLEQIFRIWLVKLYFVTFTSCERKENALRGWQAKHNTHQKFYSIYMLESRKCKCNNLYHTSAIDLPINFFLCWKAQFWICFAPCITMVLCTVLTPHWWTQAQNWCLCMINILYKLWDLHLFWWSSLNSEPRNSPEQDLQLPINKLWKYTPCTIGDTPSWEDLVSATYETKNVKTSFE